METKVKKTIDRLTKDSVSILTQQFADVDGVETQIGENHRCAYVNSKTGRKELQKMETESVANSVFAIWGDVPTVSDPEVPDEERG